MSNREYDEATVSARGRCENRRLQVAELRLSSERRGDSLIVAVGGELDIVTSRQLDEYLTRARREHRRIVLDLAAVDFMDTSSLAVIIGHWKRLQATGGTLVLAGARYRYTKTLWITGLADRLPLFDDVEAALAAEAQAAPADPAQAPPDGQAATAAAPRAKRRAAPG
jgi:anti-sigma B factor antagonist